MTIRSSPCRTGFGPTVHRAERRGIGRWELDPDEALIITGRFPRCRFANVMLWNKHMQTPNHDRRQVSLNRVQIDYRPDGTFRIVVAHSDPGVPNWLDTRGLPRGTIFWRFLLPAEPLTQLETKVIQLSDLRPD